MVNWGPQEGSPGVEIMGFLWCWEQDKKIQGPERRARDLRRGYSAHLRLGLGPEGYRLSFNVCELYSRESRVQQALMPFRHKRKVFVSS